MNKLTIREIEATPVMVPFKRPPVARIGAPDSWLFILIDILTEEGVVGRSYLQPYAPFAHRNIIPAIEDLATFLRGSRVAPVDQFNLLAPMLQRVIGSGIMRIALSGLDMALWDAVAKAADLPLAELLGSSLAPLPSYNSNGLWLIPHDRLAEEACELLEEGGFRAVKARAGRGTLAEDMQALEIIRDAIGDDVDLMVDFNQAMPYGEALQRCVAMDDLGLLWLEEPVMYDDFRSCAELRAKLRTPIQIGENFYGPRDVYNAIEQRACDYIMPDMMRIGGVTGWLQSAPIAAAAGIQVSSHLYPEASAHLLRVTQTAHLAEWVDWANPILEEPWQVDGGFLHMPDRPGLGISWDQEAVDKYRIQ